MTGEEPDRALHALDVTQQPAPRALGYDERTMRRWIAGDRAIRPAVAILMRMLARNKVALEDIAAAAKEP
jgi:hypothetical protein